MKKLKNNLLLFIISGVLLTSCVSQKKYQELETKSNLCEEELNKAKTSNIDLNNSVTELNSQLERIKTQINGLKQDTLSLGRLYRSLSENYDQLQKSYEELVQSNQKLTTGNKEEAAKMMSNIQKLQEDLQKRDDELKTLELDNSKRKTELEILEKELKQKEIRLNELQTILDQKDAAVNALKTKVAKALMGYQKNGLNVFQKNGKVYVSMDEKLLFASGSFTIDPQGEAALKDIAKILEQDKDINVMIEGHTDDVPYLSKSDGQIKDNWDLSVMRATSVVKTLLKNSKIDPKRLSASGRGEYLPLDNSKTKESRSKNRRTEIILTPKLDELFKILE